MMAPLQSRKHDHEKILKLRDLGLKPGEIAERLGVKPSQVYDAVRTFKMKAGTVQSRPTPSAPRITRPALDDRPGVMVITVATKNLDGDGLPKRMPVSLPRLSILDGWTGAA